MSTQNGLIRLHSLATFDRGAKARWLLTEMGLKFEERWLDREKNELESAAFLKLNPMGRVPVAEVGDQVMFESGAICAYLADLHLDKGMAPALAAPERAEYQKWMYFASATVDSIQSRMMIIEDIPPGEVQKAKEKALQDELRDSLEALDQVLSKSSYLVGNRFGAADICVSYQLYWLPLWPELKPVMDAFPRVVAYIDRIITRPAATSMKAFDYKAP
jgi:glutathione S-transferase